MFLTRLIQSIKKRLPAHKASQGYGLVMLMTFLATTVLIGASMSIMMGPGLSSYLGTNTQNNISAKALAERGMETVLTDIQTQINAGTTISTAYTYPATNITMPQDPTALGGATVTAGSFSASIPYARANTYLVKVTATINNSSAVLYRLLQANRNMTVVDSMTGPTLAFGVRKLRSAYTGPALRVRRSIDDAEQDIGFDGNGNLDMDSLNSFLSTTTLPMSQISSAGGGLPQAAFGLRRLRSQVNFGASLIRVRRSSDNAEQDIGYTPAGDLDINALLDFVGSGTGYVTTWYDQSTNGYNATQSTPGYQPTIVTSGQLNMINNRPAIKYDGVDDRLAFTRTIGDFFSIVASYSVIAGKGSPVLSGWGYGGGLISTSNPSGYDFGISVDTSGNIYAGVGSPTDNTIYVSNPGYNDNRIHWMAFTRDKSNGWLNLHVDNNRFTGPTDSTSNTSSLTGGSEIWIGGHPDGFNGFSGYCNELYIYNSGLSKANVNRLKRNMGWYFNQAPDDLGLSNFSGATAAYSLRKIIGGYGGYAIKVRRSSDNTTQDIGFDVYNSLDVVSLMNFVGTGSGYIDTWYDQSGNARHATQATTSKQPRIVNAGVLEMQDGKPTVRFISANSTSLTLATEVSGINDYHALGVGAIISGSDLYFLAGNTVTRQLLRLNGTAALAYYGGTSTVNVTIPSTTTFGVFEIDRVGGVAKGYYNGYEQTFSSNDSGAMTFGSIGALQNTAFANAYISEVFLYSNTFNTTTRQNVERSLLNYYTPPVPIAYVTKWYDQSGNGYDMLQPSPTLQPTLIMPRYGSNANRPSVNFNGSQKMYNSAGMPTTADYTKVAVFSYYNTQNNNIISNGDHALYMNGSTNVTLYHSGNFATSPNSLATLANQTYAVSASFVQSTHTGTVYRLNVAGTPAVRNVDNTTASSMLGSHGNGNFLKGTISEVMVFARVLNATDRTAIYNDERAYFGAQ